VSATPAPQQVVPLYGFAPVYFPSTVDASRASVIRLNAGEERYGVTIAMDLVATARVEAVLTLPDGANPSSLQIFLMPQAAVPAAGALMAGRRDAEGRVIFAGVAPGAYTIIARAARAGAAPATPGGRGGGLPPLTFHATVDVTVDGQDLRVPVDLREGMTVSGHIVFDDAAAAPKDHALTLGLVPLKSGPALTVPRVAVNFSGEFTIAGVPAGRYRIDYSSARSMDTWSLASATAVGANVLDAPMEVRAGEAINDLTLGFTNKAAELSGRLETASGRPATEAYIIAFTPNQAAWLPMSRGVRQTRPATDGVFSIRGLPAGDYLIAAVTDVEPGQWYDPAFLSQLVPAAVKVTVRAGERVEARLRVK
jgi:hypothetical protein